MKKFERWTVAYRRRTNGDTLLNNTSAPFSIIRNSWRYWAADPHLIEVDEETYVFAEVYDRILRRGLIGYSIISNDVASKWKIALSMPHHLSYPHLFKHDGSVYMIAFENKELPDFVPSELEEYTLPKRNTLPPSPEWTVLYVGKGKRAKLSRGDLAGFFIKKGGLKPDEVGTILVFQDYSYVAVKLNRMRGVLKKVEGEKIKGVKTIIMPARGR